MYLIIEMENHKVMPSSSVVESRQLIKKQEVLINKLVVRVETLKRKYKFLKTKYIESQDNLNLSNEELELYKSYCKDVTHMKWD